MALEESGPWSMHKNYSQKLCTKKSWGAAPLETLQLVTDFRLTDFHLTDFCLTNFRLTAFLSPDGIQTKMNFHLTDFCLKDFHLTDFRLTGFRLTNFRLEQAAITPSVR